MRFLLIAILGLLTVGCGPRVMTITITVAEDERQQRLYEQWIAEHTVREPVVAQRPTGGPKH